MSADPGVVCVRCKRTTSPNVLHRCGEDRARRRRATVARVQQVPQRSPVGVYGIAGDGSVGKLCPWCRRTMLAGQHLAASGLRHFDCGERR